MRGDDEWIEESIRAYLDGRSPLLRWIAGMIDAYGNIPAAAQMFNRLRGYGSAERYNELQAWFESGASITILPRFQS
jgi:hypothetical protein